MKTRWIAMAAAAMMFAAGSASAQRADARSGYTYLRSITGDVTVASKWNGRVDARRNMPITAGDEIIVSDAGRAEVALADGNILHVGGGTRAAFESLYSQQGEDDDFSSIQLKEGSVILSAIGANADQIPRIDTDDATVYLTAGGRVRVNMDSRHGTVVIDRSGSLDVRTRSGSYKLRAGQYMTVHEDDDPEIERGSFSRDRFDVWAADQLERATETRSASARYVDDEYATDVEALDGYGDWNYSDTYSGYVWSPRVEEGWSPYSSGSWYYTPAGLTWWSYDPWGWFPHHYGNWFFDASFNRWCWSPANVYSPAWVYWAYTPSYVGWCPVGWYSGNSSWNSYYRGWGGSRGGAYLAIHGTFNTRQVDFRGRGWNFSGAGGFANAGRAEVLPGSRVVDRLGSQVAISSRPIVVHGGRPGDAREAVREFVRQAPRTIERTASPDSARLAPILARERTLPPSTVEALRERSVVAERGRLVGAAAADIAPRGAMSTADRAPGARREAGVIERGRPAMNSGARADAPAPTSAPFDRGRAPVAGDRSAEAPAARGRTFDAPAARTESRAAEDWRSRPRPVEARPAIANDPDARVERARPESPADWRGRPAAPATRESEAPALRRETTRQDWRSRPDVPPARRVIEGAVPRDPDGNRGRVAPARPEYRPEARPEFRSQPAPPRERASEFRAQPRPEYRPQAAPPPPRAPERAPVVAAPPPQNHPAPPPAPRSAPPERGRKD
ncbi:MAG: DUF6600 domain-containing protein [Acidobacteriota bacterium]